METKEMKYKIVLINDRNDDQDLLGVFETEMQAQSAKPKIFMEHKLWIRNINNLVVKPIDPEKVYKPVCTDYMHYVFNMIPADEWKRVMMSDASAEICTDSLMCGGATYYYLSRIIPKEWTVIDIGASYGAQSYLFKDHAKYIAVEPCGNECDYHFEYFKAHGTERYETTAGAFIEKILPSLELDLNKTFAICNYVPKWFGENPMELVRQTFTNCYVYYP